jgi:hypothetical protein
MFVDPLTANAVPDGATELTLKEWRSIGTDLPTRDIVWDDRGRRTYSMRVALYRPIVTPRNPWHESRVADGGPATQYTVPLGLFGGR